MHLDLERAWFDDLKVHDTAALATMVYALKAAKRTLTPRVDVRPRASRHGMIDRTSLWGGQVFDLAMRVDDPGGSPVVTGDAYDLLRAKFDLEGPVVFKFRRRGRLEDERALVNLASSWDDSAAGWAPSVHAAVSLSGEDPRIYSDALKSASYDPSAAMAGGGAAIPLVFPLVFTTTTATHITVLNVGTAKSPPIFTVEGPALDPTIDNDSTGESIFLDVSLGSGDTVVVDVENREVYLNGEIHREIFDARQSTWFEIWPGTNQLRLRGTALTSDSLLRVQFRDARI